MPAFTSVLDDLYETLPPDFPPGPDRRDELAGEDLAPDNRSRSRLSQWIAAVSAELNRREDGHSMHWRFGTNIQVGLIPRFADDPLSGRGKFGVAFLVDAPGAPQILAEGLLIVGGRSIPVQFQTVSIRSHSGGSVFAYGNPVGRCVPAKLGSIGGVLTARHVVEKVSKADLSIVLDDGCSSSCAAIYWGSCEIDAAFLEAPGLSFGSSIPIAAEILPGDVATIAAAKGAAATQVIGVSPNPSGKYDLPRIPLHLWLNTPGMPGDSGALVAGGGGDGLGIYLGLVKGLSGDLGYAADIRQIHQLFGADLYA